MPHITEMGVPRDHSKKPGNPTSALQAQYQQLMTIQDPDELAQTALEIVQPLVGSGMSEQNFRKFKINLQDAAQRGLVGLQGFLSNYILAGSGLSVGRGGRGGPREAAEVAQIASMISEDVNDIRKLTPQQEYLKNLVESCTRFKVIVR